MKMTLRFCTRYNGVYLTPDDDDIEITDEMEKVLDEVSDTLPSMTYNMVSKWDYDLTDQQIERLIRKAKKIIKPVIPDAEIEFEYDDYSS